jgi:hypothetical protein
MTNIAILSLTTTFIAVLTRTVTTIILTDRVFTHTIQTGGSLRSSQPIRTSLAIGTSIPRSNMPPSRRLVSYPPCQAKT